VSKFQNALKYGPFPSGEGDTPRHYSHPCSVALLEIRWTFLSRFKCF